MFDGLTATVTTTCKILKFAEGADPAKDKPIEVVQQQQVLTKEQAKLLLAELGGDDTNGAN